VAEISHIVGLIVSCFRHNVVGRRSLMLLVTACAPAKTPTWSRAQGEAVVCFGSERCLRFMDAEAAASSSHWQSLLPPDGASLLTGNRGENCPLCNGSIISDRDAVVGHHASLYHRLRTHPKETWDLSAAVSRVDDLPHSDGLAFMKNSSSKASCREHASSRTTPSCRSGFVPELGQTIDVSQGWRSFRRGGSPPFFLPCSSARGEDAAVLRSFFTDAASGRPLRDGTFLEIGGVDGLVESNTWVPEHGSHSAKQPAASSVPVPSAH